MIHRNLFFTHYNYLRRNHQTVFSLSNLALINYQKLFQKKNPYFNINKNINDSLVNINSNEKNTNGNRNSNNNYDNFYISGFPGTQLDSLLPVNQAIEKLGQYSESLRKYSRTIESFLIPSDAKPEKKQSKKKQRKSKDAILFDDLNEKKAKMLLIYNSIMGIKEYLTAITPEKEKKAQKVLKKVDEKLENGHCKPATATKVISELNEIRSNSERLELLKKLDECYIQFHENMPDVVKSFCVRYKFIKKMIKKLDKKNTELIDNLAPIISEITKKASEISFEKDFPQFIAAKKIIRYDLKCDPFKPIDMSHPVFNNFEPSKIHNILAVPPVYPILMAKVLNLFTAKNLNEITVVKGKMVLIMEPLDYPWVFVMNPFTNQTGFVPSSNLEVVGSALGIITKESTSIDGISLLVGDYVAILKMRVNKNSPYLTHSPTLTRRKSSLKRTKNGSSSTNIVFGTVSSYIQETNNIKDNGSNENTNTNANDEFNTADNLPNGNVIEIDDEYDIDNDDDDTFIERLDDGRSRSVVTVMGEKTQVDLENVGIIYD